MLHLQGTLQDNAGKDYTVKIAVAEDEDMSPPEVPIYAPVFVVLLEGEAFRPELTNGVANFNVEYSGDVLVETPAAIDPGTSGVIMFFGSGSVSFSQDWNFLEGQKSVHKGTFMVSYYCSAVGITMATVWRG